MTALFAALPAQVALAQQASPAFAAALGVLARYWLRRSLESPLYLDPPRTGM